MIAAPELAEPILLLHPNRVLVNLNIQTFKYVVLRIFPCKIKNRILSQAL